MRGVALVLVAGLLGVLAARWLQEAGLELFPAEDSSEVMRAVVYHSHGGVEQLVMEESFPRPVPRPDQVLVKVHAASMNPCDYKFRRNYIPSFVRPLPKIPGGDIAGVVVGVGSGVSESRIGDRVAALLPLLGSKWGACAEYVAVKVDYIAIIPEDVSFAEAASLPLVALTAMQAFDNIPRPHSDKSILITAGSGGVGTFAIQYAKKVLGMKVVTTTCSGRNKDFVHSLGADNVIDYAKANFSDVIRNYDAILDPMSYTYESQALKEGVIKTGGQYFNVISSDFSLGSNGIERGNGLRTFVGPALSGIGRRLGFNMLDYQTISVVPNGEVLQRVFNELSHGKFRAVVNTTYALDDLATATEYLEKGRTIGKVVIEITS